MIYLRALTEADARTSYKWRNIPEVWTYTNFNLSGQITLEIEEQWLREVLKMPDQKRFGICLVSNDQYVGNVHLTDINDGRAEFHLFIGETTYWGRGIGQEATGIILDYAFFDLCLKELILMVDPDNHAAMAIYKKQGFVETGITDNRRVMRLFREDYLIDHSHYVI
jgi:RimJ/RimL family protein N-acetyltransferase